MLQILKDTSSEGLHFSARTCKREYPGNNQKFAKAFIKMVVGISSYVLNDKNLNNRNPPFLAEKIRKRSAGEEKVPIYLCNFISRARN